MAALGVVVLHKLAQHGAQMTLAERDDMPEAVRRDKPADRREGKSLTSKE
jgi:hypothetical protein